MGGLNAGQTDKPEIGHRFSRSLVLTVEEIIDGATRVGDANPLHLDELSAHAQKMGGVIASGSHVTGLFTAIIPTEFTRYGPMVGAQMTVKFVRPIYPNTRYEMSWVVRTCAWTEKLRGFLYRLNGAITSCDGADTVTVRAEAEILLYVDNALGSS